MQSPTFSARTNRLKDLANDLRIREHIMQIRLGNAERGLRDATTQNTSINQVTEAIRAERNLAQQALAEIHEQQGDCLTAQDRHTGELPPGSILIVLNHRDGEQYVIERCEDSSRDVWYRIGDDTPMTFDETIGVDEGYNGHEFFRLYTSEQVDDLLDHAGVNDLFA